MSAVEEEHGPEVTDLLTEEHRDLAVLLNAVLEAPDLRAFRSRLEAVGVQLARHEAAEELTVYPVVAQVEGGRQLRARALEQERRAKFSLNRVLRLSLLRPRSRHLRRLIHRLGDELAAHASFEEQHVFPLLRQGTELRKRQMMGAWVENAESFGPKRPHPRMPQNAVALVLAGPVLSAMDYVRNFARRKFEGR